MKSILEKWKRSIQISDVARLLKRRSKYENYIFKVKQFIKNDKKQLKKLLNELDEEAIYEAWIKAGYIIDEELNKIIKK